ncbi:hypothetical protein H5410_064169 [Solanum commersonii]|uniref:Uncharacterized protein n=1 Tax=Solanum commersonii TaxID=4109 RepID=A0A9J5W0E5_SOLCO|nr:hypothetical protein H5410_064169 [Solanum commersonii]
MLAAMTDFKAFGLILVLDWQAMTDFKAFELICVMAWQREALSSISDISLLEIVTKTHGMPNGYSKVLKDGKCLYLGFDDCRHENLRNYLIPKAMLSSWVHGDSHKWIGAGN